MPKAKITTRTVTGLAPGQTVTDAAIRGFQARRLPSGNVRFTFRYSLPGSPQREIRLGLHGEITADQARDLASDYAHKVRQGHDPVAEQKVAAARSENTVNAVLDNYVKRDVKVRGLKSETAIVSMFDRFVRPRLGACSIYDLKKSDIIAMLEAIEDTGKRFAANACWRVFRAALNWHANRDDDFHVPRIKARVKQSESVRDRILTDEEIRDVWQALDRLELGHGVPVAYPRFIRSLLLTGQRRSSVAQMHTDEIAGDEWLIPAAKMKSGKPQLVHITAALRDQLGTGRGYVFSRDGGATGIGGFVECKTALDAKVDERRLADGRKPIKERWVLHDLRRTARSIMSRCATPDVAERVLGHAIPGIRGVYDHYDYAAEKRAALEGLARHINGVVNPSPGKVVALPRPARRQAGR